MVSAWYMDDDTTVDQREPHALEPPQPVDLQTLETIGVLYYKIEGDLSVSGSNAQLDKIRKDRGYTYEDHITCSRDKLPNYDEKLKQFYAEHLHSDEEIRLCAAGSGYFDVRDQQDRWIRIQIVPGDLLILPAGIYHRFTLDTNNYIIANRYFVGEPVWRAINRPAEEHEARQAYMRSLACA